VAPNGRQSGTGPTGLGSSFRPGPTLPATWPQVLWSRRLRSGCPSWCPT